jgi:hypothetical protein
VSDTIEHGESGVGVEIAPVEPVMLVRYRAGVTGQTARTVHLVALRERVAGAVGTLCGAFLGSGGDRGSQLGAVAKLG